MAALRSARPKLFSPLDKAKPFYLSVSTGQIMEKSDISDSHLIIDEQEPTDVLLNNPSKHLSSDGVNKSSATASRTPRLHARSCTTCYRRKVKCDKVITGCSRCSKAGIPCVFPARNGTQGGDELQGRLKSLEKIVQELLRRNEGEKIEREDHHSAEVPIPSPVESDTSPIVGTNPPTLKKGRLVTIGGRSSYLTSSFWASFNEEVSCSQGRAQNILIHPIIS